MKTKKTKLPKPDQFGFYPKKDAFTVLRARGISFCQQSVESAFRENHKDSNTGIPHRRSHPTASRAHIMVRIEDILEWLQKGNSTSVDFTKAA